MGEPSAPERTPLHPEGADPNHTLPVKTPDTSADRKLPRPVEPDPSKVIFYDRQPKRPSRKKRRKRLNAGAMYFTEKDRILLETVIAYGWLSKSQLGGLLGVTPEAIRKRAVRLVRYNLLSDRWRGLNNEILYTPTRSGMKHAEMHEGFSVATPNPTTLNHSAAIVATAIIFGTNPKAGVLVTEREITAAAKTGTLSPRVRRLAPWAAAQHDGTYAQWTPEAAKTAGVPVSNLLGYKRPDMLALRPGAKPAVLEVELHPKSTRDYERILDAYDKAAILGHLDTNILYVTSEALGTGPAIKTALKAAMAATKAKVNLRFLEVKTSNWHPTVIERNLIALTPDKSDASDD